MSSPTVYTRVPWQTTAAQTIPSEIFEAWYASGRPPGVPEAVLDSLPDGDLPAWDTGQPQPAIAQPAEAGLIAGRVLDVGCGTGDNALFLAERGFSVTGVDSAPSALAAARAKARERRLAVPFVLMDALELARLTERFDTAIDSGLLHVFSDQDRARLIGGVHAVLVPGGSYHLLCFSEHAMLPGPRRLSQADIRASFAQGWVVEAIEAAQFDIRGNTPGGDAWLAHIRRI
jgi:SAM-dependent methyltransferase